MWCSLKPGSYQFTQKFSQARKLAPLDDLPDDIYKNNITHLNIGTGEDLSIDDLVNIIKKITGFEGEIVTIIQSRTALRENFLMSAGFVN